MIVVDAVLLLDLLSSSSLELVCSVCKLSRTVISPVNVAKYTAMSSKDLPVVSGIKKYINIAIRMLRNINTENAPDHVAAFAS